MLDLVRHSLLAAVDGLTEEQLDHLYDAESNSIGALLAHIAAVERAYQVLTMEEREPSPAEERSWSAALKLGEHGRKMLKGRELKWYLDELKSVRRHTLTALSRYDDEWLERPLADATKTNAHWVWFHVVENEMCHCGQIRWLRARLPEKF